MKPRRHDLLDLHPAAVVGSLFGGDRYEVSPVDAKPDAAVRERGAGSKLAARLRRRRERATAWARAQSGHLPLS